MSAAYVACLYAAGVAIWFGGYHLGKWLFRRLQGRNKEDRS